MTRHVVVVDVETNGLDPDRHQAVEVSWFDLDGGVEHVGATFVPPHDWRKVVQDADLEALRINRYLERIAPQVANQAEIRKFTIVITPGGRDTVLELHNRLYGNTLAGSNPRFDAVFLNKLFDRYHLSNDPWHHRMLDLSAYAAGVLGIPPGELPGLATVCERLGVEAGDHTAAGDVRATAACFEELFARSAKIGGAR